MRKRGDALRDSFPWHRRCADVVDETLYGRSSADFSKTANTTLAAVTDLSADVLPGIYGFEANLFVNADAVGGSKFAIGGTATTDAALFEVVLTDNTAKTITIASTLTAFNGTGVGQAGTTAGLCKIVGTISVTVAGTFVIQFAQNAASGVSTVLANSLFTVWKIS